MTIPALRSWTPGQGQFTFTPTSRILIASGDMPKLKSVADLLASELGSRFGRKVQVAGNGNNPRPGDVVLQIQGNAADIGGQGYKLTVNNSITITATTPDGAFNGTRTVLQSLKNGTTVSAGTATDWPTYPERGVMIDLGRMYFTLDWLKARVRDMASLKLNTLALHLSDDEGWRVESNLGLQSAQYLTKNEISALVDYAAQYHITVIPEVDMPAHLGALLQKYPQYRLVDKDGNVSPTKIDFTIPAARQLLKQVVAEYLPLFPGKYWHLGLDEYLSNSQFNNYPQLLNYAKTTVGPNATAKDSIIAFGNEMNAFIRDAGKTGRAWNDNVGPGTTIELDKNIVIQYWTDSDSEDFFGPNGPFTPQTLLSKGYEIVNDSLLPTYAYPTGGQTPQIHPNYLYDSWSVDQFYGYLYFEQNGQYVKVAPTKTVPVGAPGVRGSMLNVWNSGGTWTQDEAAADIYPRMRTMAQKTWNSPQPAANYTDFLTIINQVGSPND
ncbi:beta-N-acetylhexosaminidase [Paenarthrobacter sp. AB444]|uniref:beta-N-acetylhexosaminidase n=1 Tax=Paenarthrobacter sp. AB444 TaxID=3025681 RepID=UPI0023661833|nr:beta-N-acetylhexosaminidase [Paenarthrobacter sp. AB444]MDD7833905.1 beta-N-acetylhexosaminidase [Paenarthrobacter sp. AB444]